MYTVRLILQDPSPETVLRELEATHINTTISSDTDTSDHLPELLNPASYPAPVPLEKIQAFPPVPALHHGLARNRTRICSGCREFLLSLLQLYLPSKASGFMCDFAI